MGKHRLELLILASLLIAGLLVSESVDHGTSSSGKISGDTSALDPADFSIELHRGEIVLSGFTASARHEQALAEIIAQEFSTSVPEFSYRPGIALSDGWVPATTHLLSALAATQSANASITENKIAIRGVSSTPDLWFERLNALLDVLPGQMTIDHDVIIVRDVKPLSALCERLFTQLLDGAVDFRQSSADIRTSSYATLDRIVEVANDCRANAIAIRGHSDSSGDETWNRQLSRARAQAVADYLSTHGIAPNRLIVAGLGSAEPIADNSTAAGRGLNRRIEFELLQPSL
ncbi:MAG: OmpA family protein [Desulfobulbaceae bacterium]|nr:OmpA family protein [Desulfobulbaceae bacterium]